MEKGLVEQRFFPRKPIHGGGVIENPIAGGSSPIELLDISVGGISFLSSAECPKDTMWLVRFEVDGETVRGVVRIAYCVKHSLTEAYRHGAEFRDWEDHYKATIVRYLDKS